MINRDPTPQIPSAPNPAEQGQLSRAQILAGTAAGLVALGGVAEYKSNTISNTYTALSDKVVHVDNPYYDAGDFDINASQPRVTREQLKKFRSADAKDAAAEDKVTAELIENFGTSLSFMSALSPESVKKATETSGAQIDFAQELFDSLNTFEDVTSPRGEVGDVGSIYNRTVDTKTQKAIKDARISVDTAFKGEAPDPGVHVSYDPELQTEVTLVFEQSDTNPGSAWIENRSMPDDSDPVTLLDAARQQTDTIRDRFSDKLDDLEETVAESNIDTILERHPELKKGHLKATQRRPSEDPGNGKVVNPVQHSAVHELNRLEGILLAREYRKYEREHPVSNNEKTPTPPVGPEKSMDPKPPVPVDPADSRPVPGLPE